MTPSWILVVLFCKVLRGSGMLVAVTLRQERRRAVCFHRGQSRREERSLHGRTFPSRAQNKQRNTERKANRSYRGENNFAFHSFFQWHHVCFSDLTRIRLCSQSLSLYCDFKMRPSARIRAAEQFNTRGALSIIREYYCDIFFLLKKKRKKRKNWTWWLSSRSNERVEESFSLKHITRLK